MSENGGAVLVLRVSTQFVGRNWKDEGWRHVFRSSDTGERERSCRYYPPERTFRFFLGRVAKRTLGPELHRATLEAAREAGFATDVAGVSFSAAEVRWILERADHIDVARAIGLRRWL